MHTNLIITLCAASLVLLVALVALIGVVCRRIEELHTHLRHVKAKLTRCEERLVRQEITLHAATCKAHEGNTLHVVGTAGAGPELEWPTIIDPSKER